MTELQGTGCPAGACASPSPDRREHATRTVPEEARAELGQVVLGNYVEDTIDMRFSTEHRDNIFVVPHGLGFEHEALLFCPQCQPLPWHHSLSQNQSQFILRTDLSRTRPPQEQTCGKDTSSMSLSPTAWSTSAAV